MVDRPAVDRPGLNADAGFMRDWEVPVTPGRVPFGHGLILASGSPRRRELLQLSGYDFRVHPPDDSAECGICSRELPPQMVARLAWQKGQDVAMKVDRGIVVAADTVAECAGQILGKPQDREHARWMLELLRGRVHAVYTGVCLWSVPEQRVALDVSATTLQMERVSDQEIDAYLDTELWCGKAGGFGYQDGNDWLRIIKGSPSNVVGLPLERLAELLNRFEEMSQPIDPQRPERPM